jgi:hypothetical protein
MGAQPISPEVAEAHRLEWSHSHPTTLVDTLRAVSS